MQVVLDGINLAYITGFDGAYSCTRRGSHACCPCVWYKDQHDRYEQTTPFTITSRAEMPNEEFTAEISRATEDV